MKEKQQYHITKKTLLKGGHNLLFILTYPRKYPLPQQWFLPHDLRHSGQPTLSLLAF
jgi:hypothetical protein